MKDVLSSLVNLKLALAAGDAMTSKERERMKESISQSDYIV